VAKNAVSDRRHPPVEAELLNVARLSASSRRPHHLKNVSDVIWPLSPDCDCDVSNFTVTLCNVCSRNVTTNGHAAALASKKPASASKRPLKSVLPKS